jgi:hypothetical protein
MGSNYELYNFEVGKKVPIPNPLGTKEGTFLKLVGSSLNILNYFNNISWVERKIFRSHKYSYGIYIQNCIPFFLLKFQFSSFYMSVPINILQAKEEYRNQALSLKIDRIDMFFIENTTLILDVNRELFLSIPSILQLNQALADQVKYYPDHQAVTDQVLKIREKFSDLDLIKCTNMIQPISE